MFRKKAQSGKYPISLITPLVCTELIHVSSRLMVPQTGLQAGLSHQGIYMVTATFKITLIFRFIFKLASSLKPLDLQRIFGIGPGRGHCCVGLFIFLTKLSPMSIQDFVFIDCKNFSTFTLMSGSFPPERL